MSKNPKIIKTFIEENDTGDEYISLEELQEENPKFADMLQLIDTDNFSVGIITTKAIMGGSYRALLYTKNYRYTITCTLPNINGKSKGYLGCIATLRKKYVDEDMVCSNDLPDGTFSKKTFIRIMGKIICKQMIDIEEEL